MRTTYAVIGPGRLGQALIRALVSAGEHVGAVGVRREVTLPKITVPQMRTSARIASVADVVLVTTADADITTVVDKIMCAQPALTGRVFLHCSGILTSAVLSPLKDRGASVGSLHPLQTFALPVAAPPIFRETTFYFEGDEKARQAARRLARSLGASFKMIRAHDKALYHAAATIVSNYEVALFDAALSLLGKCGFRPPRARAMLAPLARRTLANLAAHDPVRALTGPIARGDVTTVERHLQALRARAPELLPLYRSLGLRAITIARRCRPLTGHRRIANLLQEGAQRGSMALDAK